MKIKAGTATLLHAFIYIIIGIGFMISPILDHMGDAVLSAVYLIGGIIIAGLAHISFDMLETRRRLSEIQGKLENLEKVLSQSEP